MQNYGFCLNCQHFKLLIADTKFKTELKIIFHVSAPTLPVWDRHRRKRLE